MEILQTILQQQNLQAMILTDGYNIHHLSGYTGHTGMLFVYQDGAKILTDSRYTEQVTIEAPEFDCVDIARVGYSETICKILESSEIMNRKNKSFRIGFENEEISYKQYKAFQTAFHKLQEKYRIQIELVELNECINKLREIKTEEEIAKIAQAERIGDLAFTDILSYIDEYKDKGLTEREIARMLEQRMYDHGAQALSFDTIAASGSNSSLPHATPSDRVLQDGDMLTMDFGCKYQGYCSDMTRTIHIGHNISTKQKEVYAVVLKAQTKALETIKPGVKCSDVDAVARDVIAKAGYGAYFGHGLGHSVGLYIHEEPRFSPSCDVILESGMVITVEPGIYLPGEFGVRIEDLIVVTEDGYRNLTKSEKRLICIA
ncbi:MAG: M24 family metallopeptidase [Wujia sp.]